MQGRLSTLTIMTLLHKRASCFLPLTCRMRITGPIASPGSGVARADLTYPTVQGRSTIWRTLNSRPRPRFGSLERLRRLCARITFIATVRRDTTSRIVATMWIPRNVHVRAVYDTESEDSGDEDTPAEEREQVARSRQGRPPKGSNRQ